MNYKNWVWDLDGTLMDTYPNMTTAFQKTLRHFGFDASYEEIYHYLKRSLTEAVGHYKGCFALPDNFIEQFRLYENQGSVTLYDGVKSCLEAIVNKGGRHFIWTHRDGVTHVYLKQWGIESYFDAVVTSDEGFKRKPDGEAMRYLIKTYALLPSETVMVGDRALDILGANDAGVEGILLTTHADTHCDKAIARFEDFKTLKQFIG